MCTTAIRTFGNRCLSAIGGENRWSRFAGWVQLSAEAAWPPRNTTSATLCAGYHAVIFWSSIWLFKSQRCYDNRHLFFSKERHKKNYHRYQNGIKNKKVSEFWMFILYQRRSWLNDYQLGLRTMVIFCSEYDVYILFSHYHCYWWFGDAMSWDPFLPWPFLLAWINFNPSMDK